MLYLKMSQLLQAWGGGGNCQTGNNEWRLDLTNKQQIFKKKESQQQFPQWQN